MSAKPLNKKIVDSVILDWRTGQYSQRKLAEKYGVSNGSVSKLCKGIFQDGEQIVNIGVQYQQALSGVDERMVSVIVNEVDRNVDGFLKVRKYGCKLYWSGNTRN